MKEQGIPCEDDITKPDKTWVFSFPMKSPDGARIASEMTAIEQLNHYLMFYDNWAEHTVSITVYVRENEWLDVGAWVFKHFDEIGGISFLPYSSHSYKQAPYQPISEEEYNQIEASTPKLDWSLFNVDEHEDVTTGSQTFACSGNTCELV
jgi:ribonucleoside-diphosphate reductase alpha chain